MSRREKGIAVALTAAMMAFVIPAAGLAVDASMLYSVKARLSMSADAAALAAARSLSNGLTIAEQEDSAIATAERFFHANFPDGYLYSSGKAVAAAVAETALRTRTVTVEVSVNSPSYFLRYLGRDMTTLRAVGKASRRDVNLMMVLDRSGSLSTAGACGPMKNAAKAFANKFANYRDRVGMLSYGGDYKVDFAMQNPPGNFLTGSGSIPSKIDLINCIGYTNTAQAIWQGYEQLKAINEPGALNALLLFTDGQPNTLTFDFSAANALRTVARGYNGSYSTADTITTFSKTPCDSPDNKLGFVANSGGPRGPYKHTTTALPATTDSPKIPSSHRAGCVFSDTPSRLYGDFGFMPPQDYYGNNVEDTSYKQVWTNGSGPDIGKIRINHQQTLINAAINAVNNAAVRIRTNETAPSALNTVIYVIGLGGVGAAEDELLNRVANTRDSPIYDDNYQEGLYVYAPTAGHLNEAFARIAGEVLRIAR